VFCLYLGKEIKVGEEIDDQAANFGMCLTNCPLVRGHKNKMVLLGKCANGGLIVKDCTNRREVAKRRG